LDESILDSHTGDQPTAEDLLGFGPYVRAMAAFLTNPLTQPPLTLSIEGAWGSGKSSFMLQLEKELRSRETSAPDGRILTVQFNAWWHDKEDALWAAFALEFIRKLSGQLPWRRRVWAWLKLWLLRFKWQDGWFDLLQSAATLAVFVFITFATLKVFRSQHSFAETLVAEKGPQEIIKVLLTTGGITAYTIFAVYFLSRLKSVFGNPLAINLSQHLNAPNYQGRVAFIEQFHQDFSRIVQTYAGSNKVYVFIDDLDRCEVPKAADLMQALNLMIAGSPQLIFIVGLDREKVAAGLAVKYEKLLPYLAPAPVTNPNGDKPAADPTKGLEYGYTFIEKFIQLPFLMPYPDNLDLGVFLDRINQPAAQAAKVDGWIVRSWQRIARMGPRQKPAPTPVSRQPATGTEAAPTPVAVPPSANLPAAQTPAANQLTEAQRQRRETIRLTVSKDSDRVRNIALMIAPALDNNPRRIKQFINLFRLRTLIANETGLFDIIGDEPLGQWLTLEKLSKFVAISLRWPLLLDDLDENPAMLNELQSYATIWYRNQLTFPKADGLPSPGPLAKRWSERQGLMRLFGKGLFIESTAVSPGTRSEDADRYDLTGLNIRRLLQVSPPVPRTVAITTEPDAATTLSARQSEKSDKAENGDQPAENPADSLRSVAGTPPAEDRVTVNEADVFLHYDLTDLKQIELVADQLRLRSVKVWFDTELLRLGERWRDKNHEGIAKSSHVAVFIGQREVTASASEDINYVVSLKGDKVIPVLLPGVRQLPEALKFLEELRPLRFPRGIDDPLALDLLAERITGKRPPRQTSRAESAQLPS